MTTPEFFQTPQNRRIAYHKSAGQGPGVVFLGGFKSDMGGTKAIYLEEWAKSKGRAFLRFDYSGHGESSERFVDGCIGEWAQDAKAAIENLTDGPQILVGSSMGGWIALLLTREIPDRIAGLVGIAAAPDFTENSMWVGFSDAQREALNMVGKLELPSDYSDEPYIITKKLIDDGRHNLVLRAPLDLPFPSRFLQGTNDADVKTEVALKVLEQAQGPDVRLTLVKDADHRFSEPANLSLISKSIHSVLMAIKGKA